MIYRLLNKATKTGAKRTREAGSSPCRGEATPLLFCREEQ